MQLCTSKLQSMCNLWVQLWPSTRAAVLATRFAIDVHLCCCSHMSLLHYDLVSHSACCLLAYNPDNACFQCCKAVCSLLCLSVQVCVLPHNSSSLLCLSVQACVAGMFELQDNTAFKDHLRDFLVQTKSFSSQDNADLFADEAAAAREV